MQRRWFGLKTLVTFLFDRLAHERGAAVNRWLVILFVICSSVNMYSCASHDPAKFVLPVDQEEHMGIMMVPVSGSSVLDMVAGKSLFPQPVGAITGFATVGTSTLSSGTTDSVGKRMLTVISGLTASTINLVGVPMSWASSDALVQVDIYDVEGNKVRSYETMGSAKAYMGYFRYTEGDCPKAAASKATQAAVIEMRSKLRDDASELLQELSLCAPANPDNWSLAFQRNPKWHQSLILPEEAYEEAARLDKIHITDLINSRDVSGLESFALERPKSEHIKMATEALDHFGFEEARESGTKGGLSNYLAGFPEGAHRKEANALIEGIDYSECKNSMTYELWIEFVGLYPNSEYAKEAEKYIEVLEAPKIEALVREFDPETIDEWGGTKLHEAALNGDMLLAKAMIREGADVDAVISLYGFTPLHIATRHGHDDVVGLLLENGADPNISNGLGAYPLDFAAGACADLLGARGADSSNGAYRPIYVDPPGGYSAYHTVSNLVVQVDSNGNSCYYDPHGRAGCLSGSDVDTVYFDPYHEKWQKGSGYSNPYIK